MLLGLVANPDCKIAIQGRRLHCLPRQISQTGLNLQPLDLVDERQRGETVDCSQADLSNIHACSA